MTPITKTFQYGQHTVTLETGVIARQATAAVLASMDDTSVLVTVVGKKEAKADQDFFPLTVNYQEKTYAAGKIPGGFFKREGRPSEGETLTARLIDRPIRPLFPEGFKNEVQVVVTVVSANPEIPTDIISMIGTSAALAISGIPFNGPIGAARVGYTDGEYVLNTRNSEQEASQLDLVVAGTEGAVLMVESEASILSEEVMLGAVMFGHEQLQTVISAVNEFAAEVNTPKWDWVAPQENTSLKDKIKALALEGMTAAYQISDKLERKDAVTAVTEKAAAEILAADEEQDEKEVFDLLHELESDVVRSRILAGEPRIDGRDPTMVRALNVSTGVLPRTHGSAVFTRGETQALVVATLGTERDAQMIDELAGKRDSKFMLHYNFPPYCVGETGMIGSPKRREIGHGRLAKRGIQAVMPSDEEFPYVVRVVSEITESNGSSSMASVCGSSLALMDAGVPIKAPIAGVAMGLVMDEETGKYAILTDILGTEDHIGDMDFKVAGSEDGITAIQMDIKVEGLSYDILKNALSQAKDGRLHILSKMNESLSEHRSRLSSHAPKILQTTIPVDKIGEFIGPGGKNIKALMEKYECEINIEDDGSCTILGTDQDLLESARDYAESYNLVPKIGEAYDGVVVKTLDFGAFVKIAPSVEGLVHVSEIDWKRTENVSDALSEGDEVKVKLIKIDDKTKKISFSIKALKDRPEKVNR